MQYPNSPTLRQDGASSATLIKKTALPKEGPFDLVGMTMMVAVDSLSRVTRMSRLTGASRLEQLGSNPRTPEIDRKFADPHFEGICFWVFG